MRAFATTAATVGAYAVAGGIAATALSDVGEVFTGHNVIRDDLIGGNQEAYDTLKIGLSVVGAGIVELGANYNANSAPSSKANKETEKSRNKPTQSGKPNSVDIQRASDGSVTKYTEFGPNGEFVKEVRITGKDHGSIPRPNVKEPNFNVNPKTGQKFQNGYTVRPANDWEILK